MSMFEGRFAGLVGALLPPGWVSAFVGPVGRIVVSPAGATADAISRIRPCDVVVDEACVLRWSFRFPVEAMRELRSAVELQVEASTPFAPEELAVGTRIHAMDGDPGHRRVDIVAVPLALVNQALNAANVSVGQVRKVTTASAPFQTLALPKRNWNWPTLLSGFSLGALILAWGLSGALQLGAAQNVAVELRASLAEVRARTRELLDEVDRRAIASSAASDEPVSMAVPSLTAALLALSAGRPPSAEVLRIELRSDGLRVGLRSLDVMAAVEAFQVALPDWEVMLDGSIAADAATGTEISTALIRPGS